MELRKQQVLLVEDDADVRELLRTVLEHAGYAVIAVDQGAAARQILATVSCDVLVSDYHLPDIHGTVLIKQARADHPSIATVLISGVPCVEYLACQCGAHAWFRKGEMLDCFMAAVTTASEYGAVTEKSTICPG